VNGPQVAAAVQGSPADTAGLTAGDTITSIAGQRVTSVTDMAAAMQSLSPGQQIDITWVRADGQPQEATVTLGVLPGASA